MKGQGETIADTGEVMKGQGETIADFGFRSEKKKRRSTCRR